MAPSLKAAMEHDIVEDHDLTIRLLPLPVSVEGHSSDDQMPSTSKEAKDNTIHIYHVRREIMVKIKYFEKMLRGNFKEAREDTVDLHGNDPTAMDIWLNLLHKGSAESDKVTILNVWNMLAITDEYGFEPATKASEKWYTEWFRSQPTSALRLTYEAAQQLLYPCFMFDHAQGFLEVSKFLVYNGGGHITEQRPESFSHEYLHVHHLIIRESDKTKTRLFRYNQALHDTGKWPIEAVGHYTSIEKLLDAFATFKMERTSGIDLELAVANAVAETRSNFDGLCLDCMTDSRSLDHDTDYWNHATLDEWDAGCRVNHQQPTWYYSFMGRRAKMAEFFKKRRDQSR